SVVVPKDLDVDRHPREAQDSDRRAVGREVHLYEVLPPGSHIHGIGQSVTGREVPRVHDTLEGSTGYGGRRSGGSTHGGQARDGGGESSWGVVGGGPG